MLIFVVLNNILEKSNCYIMKHFLFILLLFMCCSKPIFAQLSSISGQVLDANGEALPFVNVGLVELAKGGSTDFEGRFLLKDIPNGVYTLKISIVGHQTLKRTLTLEADVDLGQISMKEDALGLEEIVISGTMKETFVSESPVKIDVYTSKFLQATTSPTNLMEALSLINGVQEVVACGVCYTNSISINGLPGPYTAVLIDGTPAYGNLASVYGINGIPVNMVDRIEVIKGPNSTLYGSEAVAGVINIITKNPEKQPLLSLDVMGTSHLEAFSNMVFAPRIGKFDGMIGFQHAYINDFEDFNLDGFGDGPSLDRLSLFTKWSMRRPSGKRFSIFAKYYYEDRRNGVEVYLKDRAYRKLRGDTAIYGESIYTQRLELMGTYQLATTENIRFDYSFSAHHQDSYYGADHYFAKQYIGYINGIWNRVFGKHDLTGGATLRYQYYDDNTIATQDSSGQNSAENQFIPGLWLQDEWRILPDKLTILSGMRLDYYQAHSLIPSPRLSLKYKPSTWTTLRLNLGTGFRIVNLFAEDHAFVTGNRRVVLEEKLRPERSYSGTFNFNHVFSLGKGQGTVDADIFYTYFSNAIFPDYEQAELIIYRNLKGHAQTRGLALSVNYSFPFPLQFNIGATLMQAFEVLTDDSGGKKRHNLPFAPQYSGVFTTNYNIRKIRLLLAYTVNLTGPMALPEVYDLDADGTPLATARPTLSKPFSMHNLQITKEFPKANLALYVGLQNIFNYRQPISPMTGYNDPNAAAGFSPYFDTSYAYSPLHSREFYVGVRWSLNRKPKV